MPPIAPTARVEELVNTHEAARDQSKVSLRSQAFHAPTPFESPIAMPMSAAAPVSPPKMAEDALPSNGVLFLEMRSASEPSVPDLEQAKPIANTPDSAVEPTGNHVATDADHKHVVQARVESKGVRIPLSCG